MSVRTWLLVCAIGLTAGLGSAQETPDTSLEGEPVPAPRQEERGPAGEQDAAPEQRSASPLVAAIQGIASAVRELIPEIDEDERQGEQQREIDDLHAQQEMALWAKRMFWATLATVFVALVGIYFVRKTLLETRRIGRAQVRAYLAESNISFEFRNSGIPEHPWHADISVRWQNKGQSPALDCGLSARPKLIAIHAIDSPLEDLSGELAKQKTGTGICASGSEIESRGAQLSAEEVTRWKQKEVAVVIYSSAAFKDVFGRTQRAEFCALAIQVIDINGNLTIRFRTYPHHNRNSYNE